LENVEQSPDIIRRKSTRRFLFRAVAGIVILVALGSLLDFSEIVSTAKNAHPVYALIALALVIPNVSVQIFKWRVLLRSHDHGVRLKTVISSFFFGLAIGTLTPGQIGEFGGRALRIDTERPGLIVGLTVLDKIQFMAVIIIAGLWSFAFLFMEQQMMLIIVASVVTLLLMAIGFFPKLLSSVLNRMGIGRLRRQVIADILESFQTVGRKTVTVSFLLTLALYVIILAQFILLLFSFTEPPILDAAIGFAAALFAKSALPISIGDLGVREAATVFFLSMKKIPEAASFNASFLLSVMNIFLPALIGAFFVPRKLALKSWGMRSEEGGQATE